MRGLWRYIASFLWLPVIFVSASIYAKGSLPPPCDSLIYCHGPLLHTVQMAELYNDSKHFVDMTMKNSPNITLFNYYKLMNDTRGKPSQDEVRSFVNRNFYEPGSEFASWTPEDWISDPEFLKNIVDPTLEEWAFELNALWKQLGRNTSTDVFMNPQQYSLIYLQHPVIVPGGRFREVYYWDSYWTMEGLLLSEMDSTVKGMLQNFVQLINQYGMVPNGGRIYYTRRSQPPYLIPMVKMYYDYTGDLEFIRKSISALEKEFTFWENNRSTAFRDSKGKVHRVAQYNVQAGGARPESYREDFLLVQNLTTHEEKERMYVELKSGAESGWDYSTRWFVRGDGNKGDLSDINVTAIAPVDLNSLLCYNARLLSDFHTLLGDNVRADIYDEIANVKNQTIADLFWDEEEGIWHDLNIYTKQKRKSFYLSNVHPIWSGCFGLEGKRTDTLDKVIKYLQKEKVVDYVGGVPTSLKDSGEQWDYPNAWAPLQHLAIMGLYDSRSLHPDAEQLSFELAEKWVRTNYMGYKETNAMYEKYNVNVEGISGGGGEYTVQIGFGWSNGVAMKFLNTFGDRLTATTGGSARAVEFFSVQLFLPTVFVILISIRRGF